MAKTKETKRRARVNDLEFCRLWQEGGPKHVHEKTGMTKNNARTRANAYIKKGIKLKSWPRDQGKDWSALAATVAKLPESKGSPSNGRSKKRR